jgi:hypothetical protein
MTVQQLLNFDDNVGRQLFKAVIQAIVKTELSGYFMELPIAQESKENRPPVDKMTGDRAVTVRAIRQVTGFLMLGGAAVGLGCALIKNKNGLTMAENYLKNTFEFDRSTNNYLRFIAKKGINIPPHQMPTPDQIDPFKRLQYNALSSAGIGILLVSLAQIGGVAAERLYLNVINPEKQSER